MLMYMALYIGFRSRLFSTEPHFWCFDCCLFNAMTPATNTTSTPTLTAVEMVTVGVEPSLSLASTSKDWFRQKEPGQFI